MAKRRKKGGGKGQSSATPPAAQPSAGSPTKGAGRSAVLKRRKLPNWPLLVPALLGMALTAYLTSTTWMGTELPYCGEDSGCDLVQSSRWGTLLGLPISAWGFLGYATLSYVALRVRDPRWHWQVSWLVALTGLAVSVYLTVISLLVLEATCFYCLGSLALMTVIFAVVLVQRPEGLPNFSWPAWGGQTAVLAAVLVLVLHLHYSGVFSPAAGPEDPYMRGLAEHLTQTGAVFYGAYW